MSSEDGGSDTFELEGGVQNVDFDIGEISQPQDTATEAVQSVEPALDSAPATRTRKCGFFGSSITANAFALLALVVAAIGLLWTISYSVLSQRWTIRNDALQDCLNFRVSIRLTSRTSRIDADLSAASQNCNRSLQQDFGARNTIFLAEKKRL